MAALLPVALHTAAIYLFLVLMLRLLSRRQLGQFTAIDLVIIILLGSAVETAMVNGNTTLPAGIVSAATLLAINRGLSELFLRFRGLRHIVCHGPMLLIHNSHYVEENLRRAGLTKSDVLQALRERESAGPEDVRFAVLEADGTINVVPCESTTHKSKRNEKQPTAPLPVS